MKIITTIRPYTNKFVRKLDNTKVLVPQRYRLACKLGEYGDKLNPQENVLTVGSKLLAIGLSLLIKPKMRNNEHVLMPIVKKGAINNLKLNGDSVIERTRTAFGWFRKNVLGKDPSRNIKLEIKGENHILECNSPYGLLRATNLYNFVGEGNLNTQITKSKGAQIVAPMGKTLIEKMKGTAKVIGNMGLVIFKENRALSHSLKNEGTTIFHRNQFRSIDINNKNQTIFSRNKAYSISLQNEGTTSFDRNSSLSKSINNIKTTLFKKCTGKNITQWNLGEIFVDNVTKVRDFNNNGKITENASNSAISAYDIAYKK